MRMLSKLILTGAFGSFFAAVAPAQAEEGKQRFTHEGYTYIYEVKDTKLGQRISGRRFPDAVAFNLAVRNGKVAGTLGSQPVTFTVDEAKGAASK